MRRLSENPKIDAMDRRELYEIMLMNCCSPATLTKRGGSS